MPLRRADKVRRKAARALEVSLSGHNKAASESRRADSPVTARYANRASALRVSNSTLCPSRSRWIVPNK